MRHRSREVITPPLLDLPAPVTRRTMEVSVWDRIFIRVLRPAAGFVDEILVMVLVLVVHHRLAGGFGSVIGGVMVFGAIAVLLAHPASRSALVGFFHASRLRRRWFSAVRHAGLATANDRVPKPTQIRRVPPGDRLRVKIPVGSTVTALQAKAEVVATCLEVMELRVVRDRHNARYAQVTVVRRDPLAGGTALPWPNLSASSLSLWEPIPAGIDEMGETEAMGLIERNLLIGGEPGAGKSVVLSMAVATAALDPGVELRLFDPALVELAVWERCAASFVGTCLDEAISVLEEVQAEMERRYLGLLEQNKRKISRSDGDSLIVLAFDELAWYLGAERKASDEITRLLKDVVGRGRKTGIITVAAILKPESRVIDTNLRDLFGFRWALRCSTSDASDTILGKGWATKGYSADSIDAGARGVGYLRHEGDEPTRLKAFYLSDDDLAVLASRAEVLRRPKEPTAPLHLVEDGGEPGAEAAS